MKIVVLLGNENDSDGNLSPVAMSRADTAVRFLQDNAGWVVLPTGAFGDHFNTTSIPHGRYLTNYLLASGIPQSRILPHTNSANTVQDAICAHKIASELKATELVVISSAFHMARVKFIFERVFEGVLVTYLTAPDRVDQETLAKLLAHEETALHRLQAGWEQILQQNSQMGQLPFPNKD